MLIWHIKFIFNIKIIVIFVIVIFLILMINKGIGSAVKYSGLGNTIRDNQTSIFIVKELNLLMIKVGLEWKTCYRLYGN